MNLFLRPTHVMAALLLLLVNIKAFAQDIDWGSYASSLDQKVKQIWIAPPVANQKPMKAKVALEINNKGKVNSVRILESSGSRDYDIATVTAFTSLKNIDPFPAGYNKKTLPINFVFSTQPAETKPATPPAAAQPVAAPVVTPATPTAATEVKPAPSVVKKPVKKPVRRYYRRPVKPVAKPKPKTSTTVKPATTPKKP